MGISQLPRIIAHLIAQGAPRERSAAIIERATLPDCLEISAWTEDGEIMGVRHKELDIEGVQFHPESILSEHGHALLENFIKGRRA